MDSEAICRRIEEILNNKTLTDMEKFELIKQAMNQWDEYVCWGENA